MYNDNLIRSLCNVYTEIKEYDFDQKNINNTLFYYNNETATCVDISYIKPSLLINAQVHNTHTFVPSYTINIDLSLNILRFKSFCPGIHSFVIYSDLSYSIILQLTHDIILQRDKGSGKIKYSDHFIRGKSYQDVLDTYGILSNDKFINPDDEPFLRSIQNRNFSDLTDKDISKLYLKYGVCDTNFSEIQDTIICLFNINNIITGKSVYDTRLYGN